jgi:hypothetical protein
MVITFFTVIFFKEFLGVKLEYISYKKNKFDLFLLFFSGFIGNVTGTILIPNLF